MLDAETNRIERGCDTAVAAPDIANEGTGLVHLKAGGVTAKVSTPADRVQLAYDGLRCGGVVQHLATDWWPFRRYSEALMAMSSIEMSTMSSSLVS